MKCSKELSAFRDGTEHRSRKGDKLNCPLGRSDQTVEVVLNGVELQELETSGLGDLNINGVNELMVRIIKCVELQRRP